VFGHLHYFTGDHMITLFLFFSKYSVGCVCTRNLEITYLDLEITSLHNDHPT
jgi:hypothetical protein